MNRARAGRYQVVVNANCWFAMDTRTGQLYHLTPTRRDGKVSVSWVKLKGPIR